MEQWGEVAPIYYNVHRWYETGTGRYTGPDPLGLWGDLNLYRYASANPLSWVDPSGLSVLICSRKTHGPMPGNHAYFWDDREGLPPDQPRYCGKGKGDPTPETGPSEDEDADQCTVIPGSPGRDDDLMGCCRRSADSGAGG